MSEQTKRDQKRHAEENDGSMKPWRNIVLMPRVPEGDGGGIRGTREDRISRVHVRLRGVRLEMMNTLAGNNL